MKAKYLEILDLVLSNPANQLSKSSRDMLETMKNGLKIEKEDHSEEMLNMLLRILDLNVLPAEIDDEVISLTLKGQGYDMSQIDKISQQGFEKSQQLINKVKDNGK